jgi:hypothetical protein
MKSTMTKKSPKTMPMKIASKKTAPKAKAKSSSMSKKMC